MACDNAKIHGRSSNTMHRLAECGALQTAKKIERKWVINGDKEYPVKKRKTNKPITVVSLFSGCGGMDLGFIGGFEFLGHIYGKTGFKIVWANEIGSGACKTYCKTSLNFITNKNFLTKM